MHDHRTDPGGPGDPANDQIAQEAATGIAALEGMLAKSAVKLTGEEAWRQANVALADGYASALEVPGLCAWSKGRLVEKYLEARRIAGREPLEEVVFLGWTAERYDRHRWHRSNFEVAYSEGGVYKWDAIDNTTQGNLYRGHLVTVEQVRVAAEAGRLQKVDGIGPSRERAILEALDATDGEDGA